jgi:polyhydroxyalkanoic acid synthase PhaR subunit
VADQKNSATDPFTAWRDWLGQAERQLNSFFNDLMGSDQYNRAMGQFNNFSINVQKNMADTMSRYLSSLNLPTREDFAALGRRLSAIEQRLNALEARQGDPVDHPVSSTGAGASMPRPPRTRKPPQAEGKNR